MVNYIHEKYGEIFQEENAPEVANETQMNGNSRMVVVGTVCVLLQPEVVEQ